MMLGTVAVSEWTLREPSTRAALTRIARAGFRSVELGGAVPDIAASRSAVRSTGLAVSSVCPLLGPSSDLASSDQKIRTSAIDVVRRWVDFALELGAPVVIVVPSDRSDGDGGEDALARAAASLQVVLDSGGSDGPYLVIEPLNRYESHIVNTVDAAARLCARVGSDRMRAMGDTFHMGIEEDDPLLALRTHADRLAHIHLADNQRRAPGTGRLDFAALRECLDDIGFAGNAALECLPCSDDDLRIAASNLAEAGWAL